MPKRGIVWKKSSYALVLYVCAYVNEVKMTIVNHPYQINHPYQTKFLNSLLVTIRIVPFGQGKYLFTSEVYSGDKTTLPGSPNPAKKKPRITEKDVDGNSDRPFP